MNEKHITIDRRNSVEFSFHASTNNTELKELIQSIWDDFSYDEQLDIDGTSNNKGVLGIHSSRCSGGVLK
jgi:hypothetical protein